MTLLATHISVVVLIYSWNSDAASERKFIKTAFPFQWCIWSWSNAISLTIPGTMYRVLVLCRSLAQATEFQGQVPASKFPDIQFIFPATLGSTPLDLDALYCDCEEIVLNDSVDAVLSLRPGLEVVQAAVAQRFSKSLRGPSLEAAVLCTHRYYCQRTVTAGFGGGCALLQPDDLHYDPQCIGDAIEEVGLPCLAGDCFNTELSIATRRVRSSRHLLKEALSVKNSIQVAHNFVATFLDGRLDDCRFDLLKEKPQFLLEEYWDPSTELVSVHKVKCFVADGEFTPWIISDVTFWQHRPRCLKADCAPSTLDHAAQFQIWAIMRECVQRLINHGFNNQVITARVLFGSAGLVRVLDLQACLDLGLNSLYEHVYQHGDSLRALLDTLLGRMPGHPKPLPRRYAMRAAVVVFGSGFLHDLVNVKVAKSMPSVVLLVDEKVRLETSKDNGCQVATISALGRSKQDCEQQVVTVVRTILKEQTECAWLELIGTSERLSSCSDRTLRDFSSTPRP